MTYLFVGGPADGELIYDIEGNVIKIPSHEESGICEYRYIKSGITFNEYGFFIPIEWSDEKAMGFLIEMYSNLKRTLEERFEAN